ncbi:DUF349 domain-containing protein [uncultured Microscilla sp.]|uniref:DUF349 domain-containing protein n=1 Tax=uncultured Microscilla sp. TaxID=432653 RepID=UPI0026355873|nr:DUF349 domain-containing protein [uncultured Microscilla sp.]
MSTENEEVKSTGETSQDSTQDKVVTTENTDNTTGSSTENTTESTDTNSDTASKEVKTDPEATTEVLKDANDSSQPEQSAEESASQPEASNATAETASADAPEITSTSSESTSETTQSSESTQEDPKEEDQKEEEKEEDYSQYDKDALVALSEQLKEEGDLQKVNRTLNKIKPFFDEITNLEREEALEKFKASGGDEGDFEYKQDENTQAFYNNYKELKSKRSQFIAQQEKQKDENQKTKERLLEEIRALVDSEESHKSMEEFKKLQEQWKAVGPVPPAQSKSLWASYNALMELYYNKRSIYFELKELDRRKNLEKKLELCERAEKLAESSSIQQAIKELHELHNDYKHIGPIPREEQDKVWARFKAASDIIYNKKREYYQEMKQKKDENLALKLALCEKVEQEFAGYQSEKIADWNTKTKELLEIQKQWEEIRFIPKEKIKEVSKRFWGAFKSFFHNKNNFFKTVEQFREENLAKKVALCEKAEELTASNKAPQKVAQELKDLQKEWKEIGPAPAKQKQAVYERFKKVCDAFFENRRKEYQVQEEEYLVNLEKKQALCAKIDALEGDELKAIDEKALEGFVNEWKQIGFVPKKDKKSIEKQFEASVYGVIKRIPEIEDSRREALSGALDVVMARLSPNASKKLNQKEGAIRKKISKLENNIDTLKNNLGFFANSKKANKLKEDFEKQVETAEKELNSLKKQLKALKKAENNS